MRNALFGLVLVSGIPTLAFASLPELSSREQGVIEKVFSRLQRDPMQLNSVLVTPSSSKLSFEHAQALLRYIRYPSHQMIANSRFLFFKS